MELSNIKTICEKIRGNVNRVIVGKESVIDLTLIALVASGHVLLEDVPGMGKTMLAKALALSMGCDFKRIQFTPDLLPTDLTGLNFFNPKEGEFKFRAGAVFTNILLADEINRATPRTQSSLLECMEERQVTIDGDTMRLSAPFIVVATQNPVEIQGTFPLPEAQLDRFMVKISMNYPTSEENVDILKRFDGASPLESLESVVTGEEIVDMQNSFSRAYISDALLKYITDITEATRNHAEVILGVSPRGALALMRASKVRALLSGREFVTPDDVKEIAPAVLCHRFIMKNTSRVRKGQAEAVLAQVIASVEVPTEDFEAKR